MPGEVVVAVVSLIGTLAGSLFGVLAAQKLVMYRLEQLEKKVDKHNQLVERTAVLERDLKTAFRLIDDIREQSD